MTHCPNPLGVGGFQTRPHQVFRLGVTAICGARTNAGTPCLQPPVGSTRNPKTRGLSSGRCVVHGGLSRGANLSTPKSTRVARNQSMHMLRKAAREALAGMTLHPDAMSIFNRHANEIYEPNSAMLILSCDQFARNEIDASQLRVAVEMARKR